MHKILIPQNLNPITTRQVLEVNPLVLAFVGDSVHTLFAKCDALDQINAKPNKLHPMVSKVVKASAQAEKMALIAPLLTEEEENIVRRARNSHVNTIAKNASLVEYKQATCFEALVGYLYLTGQTERLDYLLHAGE